MKKTLTVLLALVLVIAMSVAGTMAYLTSTTDTVTNSFTVGNVAITLDEAQVDVYGKAVTPAARVKENTYKLIPGHEYTKDPTVHVAAGSEDCWLFVQVVNGISELEAATVADGYKTIADQMTAHGWTAVTGATNVYAYSDKVSAGTDVHVFDQFKIRGDADVSTVTANTQITIKAYAVQADTFDTAAAAWAAAPCDFT
ncbi:MAG: SipW-dependent-type signal peptide-containing protein [Candidatus Limivicinus sp.]